MPEQNNDANASQTEGASTSQKNEPVVNVSIDTTSLKEELESFKTEMKTMISEKDAQIASLKEEMTKKEEEYQKKTEELLKKHEKPEFKGKSKATEEADDKFANYMIGENSEGKQEMYVNDYSKVEGLSRLSR